MTLASSCESNTIHKNIYLCQRNEYYMLNLEPVRLNEGHQIKPHAPPLVRTLVNSFEFQPCNRTPQVAHFTR